MKHVSFRKCLGGGHFFLLFILLVPLILQGQNEGNVWLTGNGQQLIFQNGDPELHDFDGASGATASICDKDGNLALYSNGYKVWNKNHEVIINGDELLLENSWVQNPPFFLPYPGREGWYIFIYEEVRHSVPGNFGNTLWYGEIDTHAGEGRGSLVKEKVFIHDNYHWGPTVAGYCDNSYFWLAIDRQENVMPIDRDRLYFYRIDEKGLNPEPVINSKYDIGHSGGYEFSPNGDKFCLYFAGQSDEGNVIGDFNFLTGEAYNFRYYNTEDIYNKAFSADSRFFYFFSGPHLIQMDARYTSTGRFYESRDTILTLPVNEHANRYGGTLRLAPDGKIYFPWIDITDDTGKLGRIRFPGRQGKACSPELDFMDRPTPNFRLPAFLTSLFRNKNPENMDDVYPKAGPDHAVCPGDQVLLGEDEAHPEALYQWYPEANITEIFSHQTVYQTPDSRGEPETEIYTLRATDGNCRLHFDEVKISRFPSPAPLPVDGSYSVCPYAEKIKYWTEDNGNELRWLVDGGELVEDSGNDSILVNWWDTNPRASVSVFSVNEYGCSSDTTVFPVRVNVELLTQTPVGPEQMCIADAVNRVYEIRNTNGSVYEWRADGGMVVSGQGTHRVEVSWEREGMNSLVVEETSTTIDTVCYGESEPLWVEVINDSLEITLDNVSFTPSNEVDLWFHSAQLDEDFHLLYILAEDEYGEGVREINISEFGDGYARFAPISSGGNMDILRMKVKNRCKELFLSNPLELIYLEGDKVSGGDKIRLNWNSNRFWENNRVKVEVWHSVNGTNGWEMVAEDPAGNTWLFINEGFSLSHFFRVKVENLDEGKVSWSNTIQITLDDKLEIPDVFTPNGDGYNDVWDIRNIRFHEPERVTVYNRHGQKIHESRNGYIPWDGQYNGEVIQGTYFYEIVFDADKIKYGQVTILQ